MKCLPMMILTALCLTVPGAALAADSKLISPAHCVFITGAGKPGGYIDGFGRAINTSSTSHAEVICPLDRDDPRNKPVSVLVGVLDNSDSTSGVKDIICKLLHTSRSGADQVFGGAVVTTGVNARGTVLTLPVPPTHFALGGYVVYCMLPRNSAGLNQPRPSIASITLTELNPAN